MALLLVKMHVLVLSIQSAPTKLVDIAFQHTTTESFTNIQMEIGWIEFASCTEGWQSSSHALRYPDGWTMQEMIDISRYAVTLKILPSTDIPGSETAQYAITADICSNPVFALNNGYELSWTLDTATSNIIGVTSDQYWIGARSYVLNSLPHHQTTARLLSDGYFFHCINNLHGLHIYPEEGIVCHYDYWDALGVDITVWVGFDAEKSNTCEVQPSSDYIMVTTQLVTLPTKTLTSNPTRPPTQGPSKNPTPVPTESTTSNPSKSPSDSPTRPPTQPPPLPCGGETVGHYSGGQLVFE
eukprot:351457_1